MRAGGLGLGVGRARGRIRGGAPAVPVAPTLTWTSPSSDATPEFTVDLTSPLAGDLVRLYRDGVQIAEHALTQPEIDAFSINLGLAAWANGTYAVTATHVRGGSESLPSNTAMVTISADDVPDAFAFTDVTGATLSTLYESNAVTLSGMTGVAAVSITGGEYSQNGGAYTTAAGTAVNGDTFKVRHTSSSAAVTATNTTLTIGGVSDTFTTTTTAGFFSDTFTAADGTLLTAHTSDSGHTWALQFPYAPATPGAIKGNRFYGSTANVYQASAPPPSANYEVEGVFFCVTRTGSDQPGLAARMAAGADTYYMVRFLESGSNWQILKIVAASATQLGGNYNDPSFTAGTTRTVVLRVNGSSIEVLIDGVSRIGPVADTAIASAGRAGVRFNAAQSQTTGIHLDSIVARAL